MVDILDTIDCPRKDIRILDYGIIIKSYISFATNIILDRYPVALMDINLISYSLHSDM